VYRKLRLLRCGGFVTLLALAVMVVPAMAAQCPTPLGSPENPTIILGMAGGLIMVWRHIRARGAK
jgi:hypothetical protein